MLDLDSSSKTNDLGSFRSCMVDIWNSGYSGEPVDIGCAREWHRRVDPEEYNRTL